MAHFLVRSVVIIRVHLGIRLDAASEHHPDIQEAVNTCSKPVGTNAIGTSRAGTRLRIGRGNYEECPSAANNMAAMCRLQLIGDQRRFSSCQASKRQ